MSHPMEGYYDGERAALDRRWIRICRMRRRLAKAPMSEFTADYTLAICLMFEMDIISDGSRDRKVDEALDKLDAFYARRRERRKKKRVDPRYPTGKKPG